MMKSGEALSVGRVSRWFGLLFVLFAAAPAFAQVRDEAGMFSKDAIAQANGRISAMRGGKTIVIETISSLGGQNIDTEAHRRFQAERINGVLVLISKNDKKLAVRVGSKTQSIFGTDKRDEIRRILRDRFKANDFDGGLREVVDYTNGVFAGAVSAAPRGYTRRAVYPEPHRYTTRPAQGGISVFGLILIIVGALFVFFLIRGIVSGYNTAGSPGTALPGVAQPMGVGGYGGGGWGGGFFSGLLGGMAGAWIGNMLFNSFSGPRMGGDYGESASYADTSSSTPDWQQDDNTASGGDVGESSDLGSDAGVDVADSSGFDAGGGDSW